MVSAMDLSMIFSRPNMDDLRRHWNDALPMGGSSLNDSNVFLFFTLHRKLLWMIYTYINSIYICMYVLTKRKKQYVCIVFRVSRLKIMGFLNDYAYSHCHHYIIYFLSLIFHNISHCQSIIIIHCPYPCHCYPILKPHHINHSYST